jgi:hypothetical protein
MSSAFLGLWILLGVLLFVIAGKKLDGKLPF